MTNEMVNTAMLVCTGVLFVSALIGGGFAVSAANAWLTNRREERSARAERQEKRNEQERLTWSAMLSDRDEQIKSLRAEVARLTSLYEISSRLLNESETKRLGKGDEV